VNFSSQSSTNRDIIKTTDASTNKNFTIPVDSFNNNKERKTQENNNNNVNINRDKCISINNTFENGSDTALKQNTVRNPYNSKSSREQQTENVNINLMNQAKQSNYNSNNNNNNDYFTSDDYRIYSSNNPNICEKKNKENFMNKFQRNDISYSGDEDESKISESDMLSSYAPSERTKSIIS